MLYYFMENKRIFLPFPNLNTGFFKCLNIREKGKQDIALKFGQQKGYKLGMCCLCVMYD